MFKSALTGWLVRRVFDWGGWLGTFALTLIGLYNALPPSSQASIGSVLKGDWQSLTLGALIPLISLIASQVFSLRSTIKPQVVNEDGKKADLKALPKATQTVVNAQTATAVERKPTLLGKLFGKK